MMIDQEKERLKRSNIAIKSVLEKYFPKLKVFRDVKSKNELPDSMNYFIFETGDFISIEESKSGIKQMVYLLLVSHHNGNLDNDILDIIGLMRNCKLHFIHAEKSISQLEHQDDYVDQVQFTFSRGVKIGC